MVCLLMVGLCQQTLWVSLKMPLGTDVPLLGHLCAHSQRVLLGWHLWLGMGMLLPAWELFHICAASCPGRESRSDPRSGQA